MAPIARARACASERFFVVDRKGVIFWSYRSPIAINPGADGILDALEEISKQDTSQATNQGSAHVDAQSPSYVG